MRGKRFACLFERWLDREPAETLKREPSAESNKKACPTDRLLVLPAGIARSGATEQRLLHGSVNRDTSFQYLDGRPCEKGQAFCLPL